MPPKYDFAAAERLSNELSQLIAKIDWFLWLRTTQRKTLLGSTRSDNWQGTRRSAFEVEFTRQQAALTESKAAARRLQTAIAHATAAAHAAEKAEKSKD
ncbi:hypothetical protein [Streptomyces sp. CNZ287]|uniref:hypothetical protein n=1 Tax=Streptomyces sp. B22F1 TaxID=3153566 RepID=UPI001199A11B